VTMSRLNRYTVIEIWWLSGTENFVSERNDFILNPFRNFKPVKRYSALSHSASNAVICSTVPVVRIL